MIPTMKRISRQQRIENAMLNCYRELFANSTPKGDFDKLMEEAEINEFGQKVIPFMDYEIDEEAFEDILQKYIEDKSLKLSKYEKRGFSISIHLGCSPKFKSKSLDL
jgi:hypothetical protein